MRILVVDDEFVSLSKTVSMLEPMGQCDAATCGKQALQLFLDALKSDRPYDLITIDINMPDMNGITLLTRFQSEEKGRGCPRSRKIIVSADSTSSNVRAAQLGQCDEFIVKPFRQAVLMEKLAALKLVPGAQQTPEGGVPAEPPHAQEEESPQPGDPR